MKLTILAAVLAIAGSASAQSLDGRWTSVAPEINGEIYGFRDFVFDGREWSVDFAAFGNAEGTVLLFTATLSGTYVLGSAAAVEGAREAVFHVSERSVEADGPAGVDMFAAMGCVLREGVAMDLTSESCGFLPSVMASGVEYDVVALQGEELFLGERSGDLSKTRPEALIAYPLVRGEK